MSVLDSSVEESILYLQSALNSANHTRVAGSAPSSARRDLGRPPIRTGGGGGNNNSGSASYDDGFHQTSHRPGGASQLYTGDADSPGRLAAGAFGIQVKPAAASPRASGGTTNGGFRLNNNNSYYESGNTGKISNGYSINNGNNSNRSGGTSSPSPSPSASAAPLRLSPRGGDGGLSSLRFATPTSASSPPAGRFAAPPLPLPYQQQQQQQSPSASSPLPASSFARPGGSGSGGNDDWRNSEALRQPARTFTLPVDSTNTPYRNGKGGGGGSAECGNVLLLNTPYAANRYHNPNNNNNNNNIYSRVFSSNSSIRSGGGGGSAGSATGAGFISGGGFASRLESSFASGGGADATERSAFVPQLKTSLPSAREESGPRFQSGFAPNYNHTNAHISSSNGDRFADPLHWRGHSGGGRAGGKNPYYATRSGAAVAATTGSDHAATTAHATVGKAAAREEQAGQPLYYELIREESYDEDEEEEEEEEEWAGAYAAAPPRDTHGRPVPPLPLSSPSAARRRRRDSNSSVGNGSASGNGSGGAAAAAAAAAARDPRQRYRQHPYNAEDEEEEDDEAYMEGVEGGHIDEYGDCDSVEHDRRHTPERRRAPNRHRSDKSAADSRPESQRQQRQNYQRPPPPPPPPVSTTGADGDGERGVSRQYRTADAAPAPGTRASPQPRRNSPTSPPSHEPHHDHYHQQHPHEESLRAALEDPATPHEDNLAAIIAYLKNHYAQDYDAESVKGVDSLRPGDLALLLQCFYVDAYRCVRARYLARPVLEDKDGTDVEGGSGGGHSTRRRRHSSGQKRTLRTTEEEEELYRRRGSCPFLPEGQDPTPPPLTAQAHTDAAMTSEAEEEATAAMLDADPFAPVPSAVAPAAESEPPTPTHHRSRRLQPTAASSSASAEPLPAAPYTALVPPRGASAAASTTSLQSDLLSSQRQRDAPSVWKTNSPAHAHHSSAAVPLAASLVKPSASSPPAMNGEIRTPRGSAGGSALNDTPRGRGQQQQHPTAAIPGTAEGTDRAQADRISEREYSDTELQPRRSSDAFASASKGRQTSLLSEEQQQWQTQAQSQQSPPPPPQRKMVGFLSPHRGSSDAVDSHHTLASSEPNHSRAHAPASPGILKRPLRALMPALRRGDVLLLYKKNNRRPALAFLQVRDCLDRYGGREVWMPHLIWGHAPRPRPRPRRRGKSGRGASDGDEERDDRQDSADDDDDEGAAQFFGLWRSKSGGSGGGGKRRAAEGEEGEDGVYDPEDFKWDGKSCHNLVRLQEVHCGYPTHLLDRSGGGRRPSMSRSGSSLLSPTAAAAAAGGGASLDPNVTDAFRKKYRVAAAAGATDGGTDTQPPARHSHRDAAGGPAAALADEKGAATVPTRHAILLVFAGGATLALATRTEEQRQTWAGALMGVVERNRSLKTS